MIEERPGLAEASLRAAARHDLVLLLRTGSVAWMSDKARAELGDVTSLEELYQRVHPDHRSVIAAARRRIQDGLPAGPYLVRFRSESRGWREFYVELIDDRAGPTGGIVVRVRPRVEALLAAPAGADALGNTPIRADGLHVVIGQDDVVRWETPAVTRLLGRSAMGQRVDAFLAPDEQARRRAGQVSNSPVWRIQTLAGVRWVEIDVVDARDRPGIEGWLLSGWDVTHHVEAERRLLQLTQRDPLTGLPNRLALHDGDASGTGALLCNLDRFGEVNDLFGRASGDRILVEVARRILAVAGREGTVVRPGSDEFVVLAAGEVPELTALAERVRDAVTQPIRLDEHRSVHLDVTVGIASARTDESLEQIVLRASHALLDAKQRRRPVSAWDRTMDEARTQRRRLVHELEDALRNGELDVHFQPVVDTETRRIIGAEALLRWNHPTLGLREAWEFVDTAESSGLMPELGRRILERSLRQAARWPLPAAFRLRVNASATQLTDHAFADDVRAALLDCGLPPNRLGLEITESTLLHAEEAVSSNLEALRDLGVRIDVDDFGTGYSSLLYLKHLPVDGIKVDRSFVAGLGSDVKDEAIVDSIALLAEGLGLDVCGEGVEQPGQLEGLRRRGIRAAQGWLFSRAVDGDSFAALLTTGTA